MRLMPHTSSTPKANQNIKQNGLEMLNQTTKKRVLEVGGVLFGWMSKGNVFYFSRHFFFYSFIPFFVRCTVWPQGKLTGHWDDHTCRFHPSPPSKKKL